MLSLQSERKEIETRIEELREEWFKVNNQQPEISDTCPCCGQRLPEDKISSVMEEFNLQKANKLKEITQKGRALKDKLEKLKEQERRLSQQLEKAKVENGKIQEEIFRLENETIPEMDELKKLHTNNNEKIEELERQIELVEQQLAKARANEEITKRIENLEKLEKALVSEFAQNEDRIRLLDEFIVHKIGLIESSINDKFRIVRFKLFNKLINGGIEETCETMVNGVPYRNLNNGTRINAGLDIIKTLQGVYGISVPIFIDNAESVNSLIDMGDTQIIRLIVSKDKTLKIEEV